MALMQKESGCNPNAINATDNHHSCLGSYGLMQVSCLSDRKALSVKDTSLNISIAYGLYKAAGESFKPWSTCKLVKNCN